MMSDHHHPNAAYATLDAVNGAKAGWIAGTINPATNRNSVAPFLSSSILTLQVYAATISLVSINSR
jgi:hypothetical protein